MALTALILSALWPTMGAAGLQVCANGRACSGMNASAPKPASDMAYCPHMAAHACCPAPHAKTRAGAAGKAATAPRCAFMPTEPSPQPDRIAARDATPSAPNFILARFTPADFLAAHADVVPAPRAARDEAPPPPPDLEQSPSRAPPLG